MNDTKTYSIGFYLPLNCVTYIHKALLGYTYLYIFLRVLADTEESQDEESYVAESHGEEESDWVPMTRWARREALKSQQ